MLLIVIIALVVGGMLFWVVAMLRSRHRAGGRYRLARLPAVGVRPPDLRTRGQHPRCWLRAVNSRSRADCMASSIKESDSCWAWLSTLTACSVT
jgi:hypothetical protein